MLTDVRYALDQLRGIRMSMLPKQHEDRVCRAMDALERVEAELVSRKTRKLATAYGSRPTAGRGEQTRGYLTWLLAESLARADAEIEFVVEEAGEVVSVHPTAEAAVKEVETTWGEGWALLWNRRTVDGRNELVHQQFVVYPRYKEKACQK